jgi:hypothetical protein
VVRVIAIFRQLAGGLPALPARSEQAIQLIDHRHLELDADAMRAFPSALMEADRDDEYWIDSDHLLRALMRFPNRAHFASSRLRSPSLTARNASREDRHKVKPDGAPSSKLKRYRVGK